MCGQALVAVVAGRQAVSGRLRAHPHPHGKKAGGVAQGGCVALADGDFTLQGISQMAENAGKKKPTRGSENSSAGSQPLSVVGADARSKRTVVEGKTRTPRARKAAGAAPAASPQKVLTDGQIAERAYAVWERGGCVAGREVLDCLQAKAELRQGLSAD